MRGKIKYLVGENAFDIERKPLQPFNTMACEFLYRVSKELFNSKEAKLFPDVISFAFWCREANINKIKKTYNNDIFRIGRGLVFHISPSNIPVNFAFSFAFSLLAGNANIVRVSSKNFPQVDIICEIIKKTLIYFIDIKNMNIFIKYERDDDITSFFSNICDARMIWGGNITISSIKKFPIPVRAIDLAFSDRYSICLINEKALKEMEDEQINGLALKFYNDCYFMDQKSCSSPHLVAWLEGDTEQQQRFWRSLFTVAKKQYKFEPIQAIDKYTDACIYSISTDNIKYINKFENILYVFVLKNLQTDIDKLRGRFGSFFSININSINDLEKIINQSFQTMTYFGVSNSDLKIFLNENRLTGLDRIVPIGSGIDISHIWDGYDLISTLSRTVLLMN